MLTKKRIKHILPNALVSQSSNKKDFLIIVGKEPVAEINITLEIITVKKLCATTLALISKLPGFEVSGIVKRYPVIQDVTSPSEQLVKLEGIYMPGVY